MYFSHAVLDNVFRLLPSCLSCLWVCCLDGVSWFLLPIWVSWPEDLLPVSAVKKSSLVKLESCTRLRNPYHIDFPRFSPIHQNIKMCRFFDWMSQTRHASFLVKVPQKRLKIRVKKRLVHRVSISRNLIKLVRSSLT